MTYRELVYMCLDEIKLASDDSYITEDHILFLISKYRAFLLRQKYDKTNLPVAESNYQLVQMGEGDYCPRILGIAKPRIELQCSKATDNGEEVYSVNCEYVTPNRFKFVGHNKILAPINYCTIDKWSSLVFNPAIEDSFYIDCEAVFEDIVEATKAQINWDGGDGELLDFQCPIESDLVSGVQELVVKDALGIAYRPTDFINNAADDLSKIGIAAGNSRK